MKADEFTSRLQACRAMPGQNDPLYYRARDAVIKEAGGAVTLGDPTLDKKLHKARVEDEERRRRRLAGPLSPLDERLTTFAELYLEASPDQRQTIREEFTDEDLVKWSEFLDRVPVLIKSAEDVRWLRIGLAAAGIDGARLDSRELLARLAILRYGAERAEIDVDGFLAESVQMSPGISSILEQVRSMREKEVQHFVNIGGPPAWLPWWRKVFSRVADRLFRPV